MIWHSNDRPNWGDEDYDLGDTLPEDSPRRDAEVWGEWREQPMYDIRKLRIQRFLSSARERAELDTAPGRGDQAC